MLYIKIKHRTREIQELTRLGLINSTWLRNIEVFEKFHYYISNNTNINTAYVLCAEDFKLSWQSVKKIITDLSK